MRYYFYLARRLLCVIRSSRYLQLYYIYNMYTQGDSLNALIPILLFKNEFIQTLVLGSHKCIFKDRIFLNS